MKSMSDTKINYDEDADVLYVSFRRSEHVTSVALADNILRRLDTGAAPKAIGLTFVSFVKMIANHRDSPLSVSLANLRNLPEDLWRAVLDVSRHRR